MIWEPQTGVLRKFSNAWNNSEKKKKRDSRKIKDDIKPSLLTFFYSLTHSFWNFKKALLSWIIFAQIWAYPSVLIKTLHLSTWKKTQIMQKQPSRGVLRKKYSENMQQIYRRIPMPKCDLQLNWNRTSAWVSACKLAAYFQNTFS